VLAFLAAPFRLVDEILRSGGNGGRVTGFTPPVDVHETEDEYVVKVDLPGVKSEDVNIEALSDEDIDRLLGDAALADEDPDPDPQSTVR